jgi:hypothetical protein
MTTAAAAKMYEAQHLHEMEGKRNAVYNPHNKPVNELPFIFGFNNGGSLGFMHAQLIAQNGPGLGSHLCSSEAYMPADLGILEGTRADRHEGFREHYPDGYRMLFVPSDKIDGCLELQEAFERNKELAAAEKAKDAEESDVAGSAAYEE